MSAFGLVPSTLICWWVKDSINYVDYAVGRFNVSLNHLRSSNTYHIAIHFDRYGRALKRGSFIQLYYFTGCNGSLDNVEGKDIDEQFPIFFCQKGLKFFLRKCVERLVGGRKNSEGPFAVEDFYKISSF